MSIWVFKLPVDAWNQNLSGRGCFCLRSTWGLQLMSSFPVPPVFARSNWAICPITIAKKGSVYLSDRQGQVTAAIKLWKWSSIHIWRKKMGYLWRSSVWKATRSVFRDMTSRITAAIKPYSEYDIRLRIIVFS